MSKSCLPIRATPVGQRAVGTFKCPIDGFSFGGSALVAQWDEFTIRSIQDNEETSITVPSTTVNFDNSCIITRLRDGRFRLHAQSARHFVSVFDRVIFWKLELTLPSDSMAGTADVQLESGFVFWCPGLPDEDAWATGSTDNCLVIMGADAGTIELDFERVAEFGELMGTIDLGLSR